MIKKTLQLPSDGVGEAWLAAELENWFVEHGKLCALRATVEVQKNKLTTRRVIPGLEARLLDDNSVEIWSGQLSSTESGVVEVPDVVSRFGLQSGSFSLALGVPDSDTFLCFPLVVASSLTEEYFAVQRRNFSRETLAQSELERNARSAALILLAEAAYQYEASGVPEVADELFEVVGLLDDDIHRRNLSLLAEAMPGEVASAQPDLSLVRGLPDELRGDVFYYFRKTAFDIIMSKLTAEKAISGLLRLAALLEADGLALLTNTVQKRQPFEIVVAEGKAVALSRETGDLLLEMPDSMDLARFLVRSADLHVFAEVRKEVISLCKAA